MLTPAWVMTWMVAPAVTAVLAGLASMVLLPWRGGK